MRPGSALLVPLAGALALLAACAAPPPPAPPATVRVLDYNIRAGRDVDGASNLERVAELVRAAGADVALLQEVDRGTRRSGGEDQVAALARLTGFHAAFGRTLDFQGGQYGIAVLSRWPLEADTLVPLSVTPPQARAGGSYEPRGALVARVRAPWGPLHVVNTHLDASGDDHYRLQEAAQVAALADSLRRVIPVVLVGGDLNAEPGSEVLRGLERAGWRDQWPGCGRGEGLTFPADAPVKRIDYLLASPAVRCDSAAVLDSRASDHRALLFVLRAGPAR